MGSLFSIADPTYRIEKKDFWVSCGHYRLKGNQDLLEDEIDIDLNCGTASEMFTSNEDGQPIEEKEAYVALFDGHGGPRCAEFMHDRLKDQIFKSPNYPGDIPKAVQDAILTTDGEFLRQSKPTNQQDGSTALVLYITKHDLIVASVGDSSGYLYSQEGIIPLVDSTSEIARGMGSLYYKEANELVANPETKQHIINANTDFIILGTWTFWQNVSYKEAVEYIIQKISERKNTIGINVNEHYDTYLSNVCLELVSMANKRNDAVNISCLLVVFTHKDSGGLVDIEV